MYTQLFQKLRKKKGESGQRSHLCGLITGRTQAFRRGQAGNVSCATAEPDTYRGTAEGVEGTEDSGFLQQNQTLRIPSPHSTGMRTERDCTLALNILAPC